MIDRPSADASSPGVERRATPVWAHRFALLLACAIVLLISAGALVTSKGAGLSVPDWPLSYGTLSPPHWWRIDSVRAEHGHRLLAGTVATLTVVLAVALWRVEPRRWVRRLALAAVATVFAQALLGGLTVLFYLPTAVSVAHAALAELFLCLMVVVALATSADWQARPPRPAAGDDRLFRLAAATTGTIYLQILIGAVMRHSGAGLAIPDFPLAFGRLVPEHFDFAIGIHYTHRLVAVGVAVLVAWTLGRVLAGRRGEPALSVPAATMAALVLIQITLGATVVLSRRAVVPNTAHVATGATLLAVSLVLTANARRLAGRAASRPVEARAQAASRPASPAAAPEVHHAG